VGVLLVPIGWMEVMNAPKLMRLRAEKIDNGRIVIGSDNNHYRFFLHLPQAHPNAPTLSTLKGTLVMVRAKYRGGSLVPRSALPPEVSSTGL